jgi:hypothetical protein
MMIQIDHTTRTHRERDGGGVADADPLPLGVLGQRGGVAERGDRQERLEAGQRRGVGDLGLLLVVGLVHQVALGHEAVARDADVDAGREPGLGGHHAGECERACSTVEEGGLSVSVHPLTPTEPAGRNAPVLSEQMSVTEPSASSAVSLRTMVLALAMRLTPMDMVTVTTGRRDSGMSETAMAMT